MSASEIDAAAAEDRLAAARVADAAASASADCVPGDDCPARQWVLPEDFEPRSPSDDTKSAQSDGDKARRRLEKAKKQMAALDIERATVLAKRQAATRG